MNPAEVVVREGQRQAALRLSHFWLNAYLKRVSRLHHWRSVRSNARRVMRRSGLGLVAIDRFERLRNTGGAVAALFFGRELSVDFHDCA